MGDSRRFLLIEESYIKEINSLAQIYRHDPTGAALFSFQNGDKQQSFGVAFRTFPEESSGVAHILEHTVLCGSRKFPIKEPFAQLTKGSLNSFLNAMTFCDRTCYAVASSDPKSFYGLVDVCLDAVFNPLNSQQVFEQEGWRYDLNENGKPILTGVVFNEMKASRESPDYDLYSWSRRALYPATPYGYDSAGDPEIMVSLTHQDLVNFHGRYYQPSNAMFFFYGAGDVAKQLKAVGEYVDNRNAGKSEVIGLQAKFSEPQVKVIVCSGGKRAAATVNWMLDEPEDVSEYLALLVLEEVLIGHPTAALRKTLLDHMIGTEVIGYGLNSRLRQPMFSIGLLDVSPKNVERMETLIIQALKRISESLDKGALQAAIDSVSLRLYENDGERPPGVEVMFRVLNSWAFGRHPIRWIEFDKHLRRMRELIEQDTGYFSSLIVDNLLTNQHRVTVIMKPDAHAPDRDAWVAARLEGLNDVELDGISANSERLRNYQAAPDPPEAIAAISILKRRELRRDILPTMTSKLRIDSTDIIRVVAPGVGITYLDVGFDLRSLDPEYLPLARVFGRAILEAGAALKDYEQRPLASFGTTADVVSSSQLDSTSGAAWLFLRMKFLAEMGDELIEIVRRDLLDPRKLDPNRIKKIMMEERTSLEMLALDGAEIASIRLGSRLSASGWAQDQTSGIGYLEFLREKLLTFAESWPSINENLMAVRATLVNRLNMVCGVTTDQRGWDALEAPLMAFANAMPISAHQPAVLPWRASRIKSEGFAVSAATGALAKGVSLSELGYRPSGAYKVACNVLTAGWLWPKVRAGGGAYGVACLFDERSGSLLLSSRGDPNLRKTMAIFDSAAEFLSATVDEAMVERAVVSAIGEMDRYKSQSAIGFDAVLGCLVGETDGKRQQMRDQILAADAGEVRGLAEAFDEIAGRGALVAIGPKEALRQITAR